MINKLLYEKLVFATESLKSRTLLLLLVLSLYTLNSRAQCDITTFTATPINGICIADGKVQVAIPGATSCTGTTATIRIAGETTDLDFITLSDAGIGEFNNLAPGNYEVSLQQGATTSSPVPVTISTTYTQLDVTATGSNTSCGTADPLYTDNGQITVVFTGGVGPYTITLTGPGGPYVFNSPTPTTHAFSDLTPGNYIATVTDNSVACASAEARSITITETLSATFYVQYKSRLVNTSCQPYFAFYFNGANVANTLLAGNATYTIAGDPTVYNLISEPALGAAYAFRTEYGIPDNSLVTFTASNGCKIVTGTVNSGVVLQNQLSLFNNFISYNNNVDCQPTFYVEYVTRRSFSSADVWDYSPGTTASFYQETPADSDNWVLQSTYSSEPLWIYLNNMSFSSSNTNTRYKIVIDDPNGCNHAERIIDARLSIPLAMDVNLTEDKSILEGTSSIRINGNSLTQGVTKVVTISRADGQSSMTINPTQPFNLAGSYTINFPITKTYTSAGPFIFGDLPLGEYNVVVTIHCGQTATRTITLTQPAAYDPSVQTVAGCLTSNIVFNMGQNSRVANSSRSQLRLNNGGALGAIVRDATENPLQLLSGQFINVPPGDYFLEFTDPAYTSPWNANMSNEWSVARNMVGKPQPYYTPVTIVPYQQMSFTTTQVFCDNADPNSGILGITVSGIPVDFIRYDVWLSGANPDTDTPLYTYNTTDLTEMTHVFSSLSEGTYIVRVSGACGFTQQNVILIRGGAFPNPTASPSTICLGETSTLAISLPTSMFDIEWFNGNNVSIGTGSSVTVSPTATEMFTVQYTLKSTFGCANPLTGSATIEVGVSSPLALVNEATTCNTNSNYSLTIEVTGTAPFTATGTGSPGNWAGNVWTSDLIAEGTNYNVNIVDTNGCNTLNLQGNSPTCCAFEVTCPTFPFITVACYAAIPTVTTLTEAEFEALGNGDGLIGDTPCGIIEITASNGANPGCNGNVDRTYIINEYEDTNTNGVRDLGENIVLNTQSCIQTITIQDTTAPAFVETLPANVTIECSAVPTAAVLTATDNCGTATVAYTETTTAGTCAGSYTLTRTWIATDGCGLTTAHVQTITVQDTTAPAFVETLPTNATVECSAVPAAPTLTATDNCGTATVAYSEATTAGTCAGSYILTRTWVATDGCGLTTAHVQTITVQDTTAPAFVETLPTNATVECSAVPAAPTLTATDNCGTATVAYSEATAAGTCAGSYTLTRTWTATDGCGLTTAHVQTITVQDTTAPAFVETLPANVTVECSAVPAAPTLTATDNCGIATVAYSEATAAGTCAGSYTLTRTWTATDGCGLTAAHVQTITVQDTTAPAFVETLPANVTVECSAVPAAPTLTATDNCGTATVAYSEATAAGTCAGSYTLTRTWIATDGCGLTATHVQTITVEDTTAPIFVEVLPQNVVIACDSEIPSEETLTALDNCSGATVSFDEQTVNGDCIGNYEIIRTWTAMDFCGNSMVHTQTISVRDTTAPAFVEELPQNSFAECDKLPEVPTLTAIDNCGTASVVYSETEIAGECSFKYSVVRTWTATDDCGNQSSHTQTIQVACPVVVYNAVSPDDDGLNDIFLLDGIDCYPKNRVEIFNRWGVSVFETRGYNNVDKVFKGYSDGRATVSRSSQLPTGTYFYVLSYEYQNGTTTKTIEKSGYLYINGK